MFDIPKPLLIGMVHLPALPGSSQHNLHIDQIVVRALADATTLNTAGFSAIMIENFGDAPFTADQLDPATIAALAIITDHVKRSVDLPVGINALRNDARSAIAVATTAGANFIRVNVHTGVAATDQGWITGRAADSLRYRRQLGSDVALFADVHVKHASHFSQPDLALAAQETAYRGLADAIIVSGPATGARTDIADIKRAKSAVPDKPILVGSGATVETIHALLAVCDGAIVGTHIKREGRSENPIDPDQAAAFVKAARG